MTIRRLFFSRAALALVLPVLLVFAVARPAAAQDSSDFFLRLNQLENQVRELAGTVEKLEYDNRRLQEQLKRFQEDVDFRFQENAGSRGSGAPNNAPPKQKRSDVKPVDPASPQQTATPATSASPLPPQTAMAETAPRQHVQNDKGTPANGMPAASGAESRGFGAMEEPAGIQAAQAQPLDLGAGAEKVPPAPHVIKAPSDENTTHSPQQPPAMEGAAGSAADIPSVAATSPGDPQADYREAEALLQRQQFEQAEMGFRQFLQSHPRDKLAPDATFNLGESYFFRGRYREAAEQYLKLTTSYPKSDLVPVGMLKLGMSLEALGARDQACATFSETARKFPNAGPELKQGLARGRSRANCN